MRFGLCQYDTIYNETVAFKTEEAVRHYPGAFRWKWQNFRGSGRSGGNASLLAFQLTP
jgi:hypothetical protein